MPERQLPTFDELPSFHEYKGCAWDVWGKEDELGTVNLLTEEVIAAAAKEIKLGKNICLNLPINFPGKPTFKRQPPMHNQWMLTEACNDDSIHINTQSGTQWDGMRHFGVHGGHNVFYQGVPAAEFSRGHFFISDPDDLKKHGHKIKFGMHNWAQHGIVGRGVLIDLVRFYTEDGKKPLPYDPWTTHAVPLADIEACVKQQGVTFKTGDILILRFGFTQKWFATTREERESLSTKDETFAGIEQSDDMKRFLWNNHFAAIASDQPAIERWPAPPGISYMHETFLSLWGMPIGEFFDLEKLSEACKSAGRYTFFFTSMPLNVLGGVGSPPNAAAIL